MKEEFVTVDEELVLSALLLRRVDSRKGENGVVAVIGGSSIYHGAPTLVSLAALRTGADLVFTFVPEVICTAVRSVSPALIVFPLPNSKLTQGCVNKLLHWLPKVDSAVIGPGLGRQRTDGMQTLVKELVSRDVRIVLDADALMPEVVERARGGRAVITPHAGEFKRVFGADVGQSVSERVDMVRESAIRSGMVILLKGPVDVISDGKQALANKTGSPAMTVGGTGDVLAGMVAALMARLSPFQAAYCGAYFNGLAGMAAARRLGHHIIAMDVIEELPSVMKKFDREA